MTGGYQAVAVGDVQAVLALYRDDARVIWPGQGGEAGGACNAGTTRESAARSSRHGCLIAATKNLQLVLKSQESISLGADYIANVGQWEQSSTTKDGKRSTVAVRTSEVLQKTDGKWLYLIDHASVGAPPPKPPAPRGARRMPKR